MKTLRPNKHGIFPKISSTFYGPVALGNGTQWMVGIFFVGERLLFVGIEGYGAYVFGPDSDPGYVGQKLNIRFDGDAANFTDFLNDQTLPGSERFGEYQAHLTSEAVQGG